MDGWKQEMREVEVEKGEDEGRYGRRKRGGEVKSVLWNKKGLRKLDYESGRGKEYKELLMG